MANSFNSTQTPIHLAAKASTYSNYKDNIETTHTFMKVHRAVKMKLNITITLFIAGVLIAICTLNTSVNSLIHSQQEQVKQRPHIVFIVADDLGWNDVSWHNEDIVTPNLENLARSGVIMDNHYAYASCSPSRASILTGYYAHRMGLHHQVIHTFQTKHVPTNIPMMSEVLREKGYATHAVGKWHLGHCNQNYTPTHRGFDSFFGYQFSSADYYTYNYKGLYGLWQNDKPYFDTSNTYSADLFSARAEEITIAHAAEYGNQKPMYLYLAFQNVHGPRKEPPMHYRVNSSIELSKSRRILTNQAYAMDQAVGHFVETLKNVGLYENTLIVFVSDNGANIGNGGSNLPFRGGKFTAWEGGTRVPAFIHSPLLANPGRVDRGLFHVVDWFPTLLGAIGIREYISDYDGMDLWETLRTGNTSGRKRETFMYEFDPNRSAVIRVGPYKLILGDPVDSQFDRGVREGPGPHGNFNCWIKPDQSFRTQNCKSNVSDTMLFDIEADPEERKNLAKILPDVVETLKTKIEEEKARAVKLQDDKPQRKEKIKMFVKDNVLYPGWC